MSTMMEYDNATVEQIRKGEEPNLATQATEEEAGGGRESKYEDKARSEGWTNLEEWEARGKAPEDWVDAPEFVRRGELMDRIKGQTKALKSNDKRIKELEQAVQMLGDHNKKIAAAEFERAKKSLMAAKVEAMDDQDHSTVLAIDEKLDELTQQAKEAAEKEVINTPEEPAPSEEGALPPAVQAWVDMPEHSWYKDDPAMRGAADALATQYGQRNFDPSMAIEDQPWDELFEHVESQLQEKFPGYFNQEKEEMTMPKARKAAKVAEPGQRRQAGKKTKLTVADLGDEERRALNEFVRSGALTEDEYLAQLEAINAVS